VPLEKQIVRLRNNARQKPRSTRRHRRACNGKSEAIPYPDSSAHSLEEPRKLGQNEAFLNFHRDTRAKTP
jgi:hypothetical protein